MALALAATAATTAVASPASAPRRPATSSNAARREAGPIAIDGSFGAFWGSGYAARDLYRWAKTYAC